MKAKFLISIILITVLLSFSSATTALANAPQPSDNPNAHVAKIETFERVSWEKYPTPTGVSPLVSGCKTYTQGVNGYSLAGVKIWSYAWNITWCYDGAKITSVNKWRTVWANYGWSFKGDIAENQSGGVGKSSYWHYAQGDFCFIETWTCITHSYPWVSQTVYGNGGYSGSAGGN